MFTSSFQSSIITGTISPGFTSASCSDTIASPLPRLIEVNGLSIENLEEYSLNAVEDQELSVSFLAEDDDNDPLTYYVDDLRFGLDQDYGEVDSVLTFVPVNADVGTITVVVSVWDNHNSFDELVLNFTVQNINDPPVIAVFEAEDATATEELEFTLYEDVLFTAPVVVLDVDSDDFVFKDSEGGVVEKISLYLGRATNNMAEYKALILALRRAGELGTDVLRIFSDSELLVQQINGRYRVRAPHLQELCQEAIRLMRNFGEVRISHIPREENAEADEQANQAIDQSLKG